MSQHKNHQKRKLITDEKTTYLFGYLQNEDKLNRQIMSEKSANKQSVARNKTEVKKKATEKKKDYVFASSDEQTELPSHSGTSDKKSEPNPGLDRGDGINGIAGSEAGEGDSVSDFATDELSSVPSESSEISNSARSPYRHKVQARSEYKERPSSYREKNFHTENPNPYGERIRSDGDRVNGTNGSGGKKILYERAPPLLGEKLVEDVEKFNETPEERRARCRENYYRLQDLVEKHGVKLTSHFTIDSDPDEMEAEYKLHKDRRNKLLKLNWAKQGLVGLISGVEFMNEKFDPFSLQLKDWSTQVSIEMDDQYSEILEELIDKYSSRGGDMPPEFKLLMALVMSGVAFHLSKVMVNNGGLEATLRANPNVISKFMGQMTKGAMNGMGGMGGGADEIGKMFEGSVGNSSGPNHASVLEAIQRRNRSGETEKPDAVNTENIVNNPIVQEREKKLLDEQRAIYESRMKQQHEMFLQQLKNDKERMAREQQNQMEQMKQMQRMNQSNQLNQSNQSNQSNYTNHTKSPEKTGDSSNTILVGTNFQPKYLNNTMINPSQPKTEEIDIFASVMEDDIPSVSDITSHVSEIYQPKQKPKPKKNNLLNIIESLDGMSESELSDIRRSIKSEVKQGNRSATRSSRGPRSETNRNNNIIKI